MAERAANLAKGRHRNEFVCTGLQHETGDQNRGDQGIDARHRSMILVAHGESPSMTPRRRLATHDFVFSHSLGRKRALTKSIRGPANPPMPTSQPLRNEE